MNRLPNETLIDFTLRYLRAHTAEKRFQQAPPRIAPCVPSQRKDEVLGGGPQPAVRLLDNSEDIAEEYSKSFLPTAIGGNGQNRPSTAAAGEPQSSSLARSTGPQVRGREISGLASPGKDRENREQPAPESQPKALLCSILDLPCETVVEVNRKGFLECRGPAIGICKHCGLPVCLSCVKWEFCSMASRHEVIVQ